jgi:hypothetical protein
MEESGMTLVRRGARHLASESPCALVLVLSLKERTMSQRFPENLSDSKLPRAGGISARMGARALGMAETPVVG